MNGRLARDDEVAAWHEDGWVLLDGLVGADEIDAATADLWEVFPTVEQYHADPGGETERWLGRPPPPRHSYLWPATGVGFRPEQHRWRGEFPFPGTGALNRLCVHFAIVDFVERALQTSELRLYQAQVLAKYTGAANYEQPMHTDRNHSWLPARMEAPWWHVETYQDPPFDVEVRILGTVEVVGAAHDLDGPRAIELTAYLALHPSGVNDDRLKTVLWPSGAASTATFNKAISRARSLLGRGGDGTFHLPHVVTSRGVYRLGQLVTTDIARFEARIAHARTCEPATAVETLRAALELVRGKPFDSRRGYEWAFSEGMIANIEATVADTAHNLAGLCLEANDPHGATWSAMQGLIAAPGDEILYRDRMLACDLAGNPGGVETVMDELCEVVEALEPYDELHPETLALYERLSHRKRSRTG